MVPVIGAIICAYLLSWLGSNAITLGLFCHFAVVTGPTGTFLVDLAPQQAVWLVGEGAPAAKRELHQRKKTSDAMSRQGLKVYRTRGKLSY